jgi:hypothetical protein
VKILQLIIALPFMLALGVAAHALLSRLLKVVLWAWSPLATGEPEAATYERRVYHSADMPMTQVIAAAALSGLPWWLALATGSWLLCVAGVAAIAAVLALDVLRWERVAVSAHNLWFQRGFGGRVHQVVMDNIRDAHVEETEAEGFTLRRGRKNNRLVRLNVRMKDKRVVALPKTDAEGGREAVQAVADHLRLCLRQARENQSVLPRRGVLQPSASEGAPPAPVGTPEDEELQRALARLRGAALKRAAR